METLPNISHKNITLLILFIKKYIIPEKRFHKSKFLWA